MQRSFYSTAIALFLLALCGCTNPLPPLTVSLSPATPQAISQSNALNISATVSHDPSTKGVSWSLSPNVGSLENESSSSATYRAPSIIAQNTTVTITAQSLSDPTIDATLLILLRPLGPQNVQPIAVTRNPIPNHTYLNGPFTSVLVCVSGTSKCQAIDGILVDTGSVGLRIFKSAVSLPLQTATQSGGSVNNCISFGGGNYFWGEVASADVYLAGEKAPGISVQLVADPVGFSIPSKCSNGGVDGVDDMQFNGILGIGDEPTDCTFAGSNPCDPSAGTTSPPIYFVCFGSEGCAVTLLPKAQQISNPVVSFIRDNNGTVIQFPNVGQSLPSADGILIFGINTEENNDLGPATVFPIDSANNSITTIFAGQTLSASFIDSGSNALFFPDVPNLPVCSTNPYYCPSNPPVILSATNQGAANVGFAAFEFLVDNFDADTQANPEYAAFGNLAGTNGAPPCQNGKGACSFDWGLPFFYDRTVFTSVDMQTVAGEPKTPWWAY